MTTVLVKWTDNNSSRYDGKSEYVSMNSIIEVNGIEGSFTSVQPGDHIVATTVYKHGEIKKWK